ncbi:MAG: hypothetical protein HW383_592, partial [Candidatus Magasanikbacteria bacterium]|nr:hypothetical protein [Candidatus Magasanikbacteria bacterium]
MHAPVFRVAHILRADVAVVTVLTDRSRQAPTVIADVADRAHVPVITGERVALVLAQPRCRIARVVGAGIVVVAIHERDRCALPARALVVARAERVVRTGRTVLRDELAAQLRIARVRRAGIQVVADLVVPQAEPAIARVVLRAGVAIVALAVQILEDTAGVALARFGRARVAVIAVRELLGEAGAILTGILLGADIAVVADGSVLHDTGRTRSGFRIAGGRRTLVAVVRTDEQRSRALAVHTVVGAGAGVAVVARLGARGSNFFLGHVGHAIGFGLGIGRYLFGLVQRRAFILRLNVRRRLRHISGLVRVVRGVHSFPGVHVFWRCDGACFGGVLQLGLFDPPRRTGWRRRHRWQQQLH